MLACQFDDNMVNASLTNCFLFLGWEQFENGAESNVWRILQIANLLWKKKLAIRSMRLFGASQLLKSDYMENLKLSKTEFFPY